MNWSLYLALGSSSCTKTKTQQRTLPCSLRTTSKISGFMLERLFRLARQSPELVCVQEHLVMHFSVWTTGVYISTSRCSSRPVEMTFPLLRTDTACCLAWYSSIKEANRLLTPASIPHRFSRTYKPISAAVINTGLIIASVDQSRLLWPAPKQWSPKVSTDLSGIRPPAGRRCKQMSSCCVVYYRIRCLRRGWKSFYFVSG